MNKIPMTKNGQQQLQEELHQLKTIERSKIIAAIAEARAHGDLKENAEYHAAKEQQGFIEGRIREIEYRLASAYVIDISKLTKENKVIFGSVVTIINMDNDKKETYKIVGEDEADIKFSKISFNSPIAKAIIGKFVEDIVDVDTPKGIVSYEINAVSYE